MGAGPEPKAKPWKDQDATSHRLFYVKPPSKERLVRMSDMLLEDSAAGGFNLL